jgi:hypothetical protein
VLPLLEKAEFALQKDNSKLEAHLGLQNHLKMNKGQVDKVSIKPND